MPFTKFHPYLESHTHQHSFTSIKEVEMRLCISQRHHLDNSPMRMLVWHHSGLRSDMRIVVDALLSSYSHGVLCYIDRGYIFIRSLFVLLSNLNVIDSGRIGK
ncbi:hypothetical protein NXS19_007170 [Fusarium pseudograminearum]|nr:hypothetical protein NXS19_007170 [Fusarium pseudograminearum]